MKDHHKKGSELISLEMKERETGSVRDRGEGRRTLVDISKGWQHQRLDACDLLLTLCVNMHSWSRHETSAGWNQTSECSFCVFYKGQAQEKREEVGW